MREIFVVFEPASQVPLGEAPTSPGHVAGEARAGGPNPLTAEFLADKMAVVIDVLRATSSILAALANGATRVIPTLEVSEALALRARLSRRGGIVLGGERGGLQIEGFDLGNTPQEFTAEVVRGKTVIMTTTNGTRAILAALPAARLYVAALNNVSATARAAEQCLGDLVLVAAGTEGLVSWEDSFCAGAIVERLTADARAAHSSSGQARNWRLSDSAAVALELWRAAKGDLHSALRRGRGGRNVTKHHLDAAFDSCGALDSIDFAARVHKEPLEIVRESA